MRRAAHGHEADTGLACFSDGMSHSRRHRDRARGTVGVERHDGRGLGCHHETGRGIDVAREDPVDVTRDSQHPVGVDATQIRPHQHVGDDARIRFGHAGAHEEVGREAPELVGADGHRAANEIDGRSTGRRSKAANTRSRLVMTAQSIL